MTRSEEYFFKIAVYMILRNRRINRWFRSKGWKLGGHQFLHIQDIEEIKEWETRELDNIWDLITGSDEEKCLFRTYNCPFCIYNSRKTSGKMKCQACGYGRRHGECSSLNSDIAYLSYEYDNVLRDGIYEALSDKSYKRWIKVAEYLQPRIKGSAQEKVNEYFYHD